MELSPPPVAGTGGRAEKHEAATRILTDLLFGAAAGADVGKKPEPQGRPQVRRPGGNDDGAADAAATRRILGLLQGMGQPKDNPNTANATTLEYRGQWQPKPDGAETGHGVVPKNWAIELASETDRVLATQFAWAGGAQLCLSNAFRQVDEMEAQAQDLIDSGTCTEDDAAVQCIRTIAKATEEREALMRRQWCDIDFQEGEEANRALLKQLERDFAGQLSSVASSQIAAERRLQQEEKPSGVEGSRQPAGALWYSIKPAGLTRPKKAYLGAQIAGDGVELHGHDDESGRQRWHIEFCEDEGDEEGVVEAKQNEKGHEESSVDPGERCRGWVCLRLLGGTSRGRRLLSRGAGGNVELCERDDGSGRQRWRMVQCTSCDEASGVFEIRPATGSGNPGTGAASEVEAMVRGKLLSEDANGSIVLRCADGDSCRQRWVIPGLGLRCSAKADNRVASQASHDDIVSIAVHSGHAGAVSLKDLSQEQMTRVISHNRNLGTAIDLIGAYLKNYEIDKADRLCSRIMPLVRERGGVWLFKALNFYTTVRMKQSRFPEALEMYKEYETLIGFSPKEAWELYDTVYRNYGWIYTSLGDYEMALEYFEKAVEVKRANGIQAHWFDQWDLGKTHARLSLRRGRPENLALALRLIREGLAIHERAEPKDVIMRCKMLNSAGECAVVLGDFTDDKDAAQRWYSEGVEIHRESFNLYMQVLGPTKPLTGWAMEDLAGALQKCNRHEEAKKLLVGALRVECSKDIIKLSSMERLLDSVLLVHHLTNDREGLAGCQDAINTGLANLQKRYVDKTEAPSYAALLKKIADVLIAHSIANREGAAGLLAEAIACLRDPSGRSPPPGDTAPPDFSMQGAAAQQRAERMEGREELSVPRAGQQEMQVDAAELLPALEKQLALLRQVCEVMGEVRDEDFPTPEDDHNNPSGCLSNAPFVPPAQMDASRAGTSASLSPSLVPSPPAGDQAAACPASGLTAAPPLAPPSQIDAAEIPLHAGLQRVGLPLQRPPRFEVVDDLDTPKWFPAVD